MRPALLLLALAVPVFVWACAQVPTSGHFSAEGCGQALPDGDGVLAFRALTTPLDQVMEPGTTTTVSPQVTVFADGLTVAADPNDVPGRGRSRGWLTLQLDDKQLRTLLSTLCPNEFRQLPPVVGSRSRSVAWHGQQDEVVAVAIENNDDAHAVRILGLDLDASPPEAFVEAAAGLEKIRRMVVQKGHPWVVQERTLPGVEAGTLTEG